MTRSRRDYFLAVLTAGAALASARFIPLVEDMPGVYLLGVVVVVGWTLRTRAALVALAISALGLPLVRPVASVGAEIARAALFALLAGAVVAIIHARRREREAADQYRRLFEQNPLPMWLYDEETLAFHAVNQAAISKYGYTRAEFAHLTLRDMRPAADLPALEARPAKGLAEYTGTWRHRTKDGRLLEILVRSTAVQSEGRAARLALLEDVTDRRALEAQLRQSQKMDAVGQLAGGIAHDFNNILTAIQGYAALLLDTFEEADSRREDVREIGRGAEQATALTRQLLAFSRKQMLEVRVVSVTEIVQEIAPMVRRLVDETIDVITTAKAQGRVRADPAQLQQVLLNLVVNARDAIDSGGHITIETSDITLDAAYAQHHPSAVPGPHVMLAVSDTGHGMDAATQARIFEPFFTTKPQGRGTGLGLSTVYGIVKQSGGHVWVYSEVGHGSTFKVYLPATAEPATPVAAPRPPSTVKGTATVLLVEDEDGLRRLVVRLLTKQGYSVHAVARPAEALALATQTIRPDVLLTDVVLPDMNGRALALRVQTLHPQCKVLFMSGYTDDAIVRHGVLDPDAAFLQKPFTADALFHKMAEVLASP